MDALTLDDSERKVGRDMTMGNTSPIKQETNNLLAKLGVPISAYSSEGLHVHTPLTGEVIAQVSVTSGFAANEAISAARAAFLEWRTVPAPKRGELIRLLGEELRSALPLLGRLVTIETGKLLSEGFGEVQEMIDICTFATGLSRQLAGLTIPSERARHRMMETWHPLGVVGIISAFNFPVAVWSWNAALAVVCGNAIVWKPSEKTPLTALAVQALFERASVKSGGIPSGLHAANWRFIARPATGRHASCSIALRDWVDSYGTGRCATSRSAFRTCNP
jgi:aldehyde dehydrogenase (NAD+)